MLEARSRLFDDGVAGERRLAGWRGRGVELGHLGGAELPVEDVEVLGQVCEGGRKGSWREA